MGFDPDLYRNKIILAPMVRIGTLPTRLLALDYEILGTIDFIDDDHKIVFRTCDREKLKVVLQLGTCDPERALKAAQLCEKDVAGIDINMGCPKEFSIKGGMGAALLTQPDKIKAILTNLVQNLSIPLTCKIRLLPDIEDTMTLVKLIESTGVSALGVHGRMKRERPQHHVRCDPIKQIANALTIPVIANGGSHEIISQYSDIEKFREMTGASSVMLARVAEKNVSIFRKEGMLDMEEVIVELLKYSIHYDVHVSNAKYCVAQMLGSQQTSDRGRIFLAADQMPTLVDVFGLRDLYYRRREEILELNKLHNNSDIFSTEEPKSKRIKSVHLTELSNKTNGKCTVVENTVKFVRSLYGHADLPKHLVINYANAHHLKRPTYIVKQIEKHFYSEIKLGNVVYRNSYLEKNKKVAEQAAALVACISFGLISEAVIKDSSVTGAPHERTLETI